MRRVAEDKAWAALKAKHHGAPSHLVTVGAVDIDLSAPSIVIGGLNGAGKSRLLRAIGEHLGEGAVVLDLYRLCEQALAVLRSRSRTDIDEMKDEGGVAGPDQDRRDDVERIIGREYTAVNWYALEVEPSEKGTANQFQWGGDQSLVPYFEVEHRGVHYTSRDMGLGEFSVHLLFWILEQYRDVENLTFLLDEPDAYLPPIGASSLLARILNICIERDWRVIVATHSAEIITQALGEQSFMLLRVDGEGKLVAIHCDDDPGIADTLLARPSIRHMFLVEDESACMLARVLVEKFDRRLARASSFLWGNGSGYLKELQQHFPRPPAPDLSYTYFFDGDKRKEIGRSKENRWPALFLPTDGDPDDLFKTAREVTPQLAERLNVPLVELTVFLDSKEGSDAHDWVNDLGERYGRQRVLRTLAEMWVERNEEAVSLFWEDLRKVI